MTNKKCTENCDMQEIINCKEDMHLTLYTKHLDLQYVVHVSTIVALNRGTELSIAAPDHHYVSSLPLQQVRTCENDSDRHEHR